MDFKALSERAAAIRAQYQDYEQARYGRAWTDEEIALGFVGDVGDLMKLIQAKNGIRAIPDADQKLAHELADCLWAVMTLADAYGVDLERAFVDTMDALERHLKQQTKGNA